MNIHLHIQVEYIYLFVLSNLITLIYRHSFQIVVPSFYWFTEVLYRRQKISTPKMDCHCYYSHYYPFCKQLKLYSHLKQGVKCFSCTIEHGNEKDFDEDSSEREKIQHTRGGKLDVKGISNIIIMWRRRCKFKAGMSLRRTKKLFLSGEDRTRVKFVHVKSSNILNAQTVCYAHEGIIRSRKQQNILEIFWPKVKFLQIQFTSNKNQVQMSKVHMKIQKNCCAWKGVNESLIFILSSKDCCIWAENKHM